MPDFSSPSRFEAEARHLFRRSPLPLARRTELAEPGAFVTREVALVPLLLTRGDADDVRVMVNLCRHRGTKLVYEPCGVAETFTCRFHGWTYDRAGVLGLPDGNKRTLFVPASPREESSLVLVEHAERHGFVWAVATARVPIDLAAHLGDADAALGRLGLASRTAHEGERLHVFRNYKHVVANLLTVAGAVLVFPNLVLFPRGTDVVGFTVWPRLPAETILTVATFTDGPEPTDDARTFAARLRDVATGEDVPDGPEARAWFAAVDARLAAATRA